MGHLVTLDVRGGVTEDDVLERVLGEEGSSYAHDHGHEVDGDRVEEAERYLRRARDLAAVPRSPLVDVGLVQAEAALRVAVGDERGARDVLEGYRLEDAERLLIEGALETAGGNKVLAAKLLGITRSSLYNKLRTLGLDAEDDRP